MSGEEISALHTQIAHLDSRLTGLFEALNDRLERIEASLLGDQDLGLKGMVRRVERLDELADSSSDVHAAIEQRRTDGDRRLHERIDEQEARWEGRWNKLIGIVVGATVASAGGAAWIVQMLSP